MIDFGTEIMRKLIGLALLTVLLVIGYTTVKPAASQPSIPQPSIPQPSIPQPSIPQQLTAQQSMAQQYGQQMAELHRGDVPLPSPAVAQAPSQDVTTDSVTYGDAEPPFTGYLAQPTETKELLPGLIVIQEWWGLNDNIKAMTDHLAAEGYAALAVDLYDGSVAETRDEAQTLVQAALENSERLEQHLVAAYNYLTDELNAPTVGSIGWCFGGTWSLNTALALPTELDAAVIYYGGQITTEGDRLQTLEMPIQGHFGTLDTRPSPETVREFESTLDSLGKEAEIYLYASADHAFANPSGTRYNEDAAELAWKRTLEFFDQHLR